jgi:hypothetical protein
VAVHVDGGALTVSTTEVESVRRFDFLVGADGAGSASAAEAREFFRERVPRLLELTSDDKIAAYATRTCYHIGQKLPARGWPADGRS